MIFLALRVALSRARALARVRVAKPIVTALGLRRTRRRIVVVAIRATPFLRCEQRSAR